MDRAAREAGTASRMTTGGAFMSNLAAISHWTRSRLPEDDEHVESDVADGMAVAAPLAGYSQSWRARLIDALEANYPALTEMLGREDFTALGATYIEAHPSRFYSIRGYGDALPQFLAGHPDYRGAPVLADLARWEWTMTEVFDAADAEPIGPASLASVPQESWAELRFGLHPSVRTLQLGWNVPQIWQALAGDAPFDAPDEVARLWPAPAPDERGRAWLLWRRDLRIVFRPLGPLEAAALEHCRRGLRFGEICELACDRVGAQGGARMTELLHGWLASGIIVRALLR